MQQKGMKIMETRIVFNGKQEVKLEEFDTPELQACQVLVRTEKSLISTGTEMIVFNRLFGSETHWDNWIKYPFYPGYLNVGIIEAVAPEVTSLKVGDRVAHRGPHASVNAVEAKECFPVPDTISTEQATWFGLAKIAAMGARVAKTSLGDSVIIVGAGPIGQMTTRWSAASGAKDIIVIDTIKSRLEKALLGGATNTICKRVSEALDDIKSITNEKMADIVIDTTGFPAVFTDALKTLRKFGKLVLLGDTGYPEQQCLSPELIMNGLTVVGAHDCHEDEEWNSSKIISLMFNLVERGRFNLEGLNTHEFMPEQCEEAYMLLNTDRAATMGVVFNWK
jgi:2-desacetyl-2-hydroxyethyl bacteriochlorophyllide A dehydrogenase